MKFDDFYSAFHFLEDHPYFEDRFQQCIDIAVVKVNPETKRVDDQLELNTEINVWLECGAFWKGFSTHDIDLDCGGATFEEAIINLANLVFEKYGDYEEL